MKDKPDFTWANWWYYNKWFVILGLAIVIAAASVIYGNLKRIKPDYQMAYIGTYPLPEETVSSIESALAAVGSDLNGDGRVVFKLNQYPAVKNADPETALGNVGWETQLMADLLDCESYFFLVEDVEEFNKNYNILDEVSVSVSSVNCLAEIDNINNMKLSRRTFDEKKTVKNKDGCDDFWQSLTNNDAQ